MSEDFCRTIRYSAALHDVGKIAIDPALLRKKEALDDAEQAEMRNHPRYGHRLLDGAAGFAMAAEIALCHHEKWDGSGYPSGLAGEAIPLSARIVALADVYDALRSARPYKPALGHDVAMAVLLAGDGRIRPEAHFDPQLLALLRAEERQFDAIWRRLAD